MWAFISTPENIKNLTKGACHNKRGYDQFYCTILFSLVSHDVKYCYDLNETELIEECKFFHVIKEVPIIETNYQDLFEFCDTFTNPSWKSECYYLIADELVLSNPGKYFDVITNACTKSDDAMYYSCFGHVTILMASDDAKKFCEFVPDNKKDYCYEGYGYNIGKDPVNKSLSLLFEKCNSVSNQDACFTGLIQAVDTSSTDHRPEYYLYYCDEIPNKYKDKCYFGFGKFLVNLMIEENVDYNQNQHCTKTPLEFQDDCHLGFAFGLDMLTKADIKKSIIFCEETDDKYIDNCYDGVVRQFSRYVTGQPLEDIEKCNLFPEEYQEPCIKQFYGLYQQ